VGFEEGKNALGQVFLYLRFNVPPILHIHISTGAGTIGPVEAEVRETRSHPFPKIKQDIKVRVIWRCIFVAL
jgi:hypothetical protein